MDIDGKVEQIRFWNAQLSDLLEGMRNSGNGLWVHKIAQHLTTTNSIETMLERYTNSPQDYPRTIEDDIQTFKSYLKSIERWIKARKPTAPLKGCQTSIFQRSRFD